MTHNDPHWLDDVKALSAEICGELREIVAMLTTYRHTIANAARLLAHPAASQLLGPQANELAHELARITHTDPEIDATPPALKANRLLPPLSE